MSAASASLAPTPGAPTTGAPTSVAPSPAAPAPAPAPDRIVAGVAASLTGQPWCWRATAADARDEGFRPDDLTSQLLLARGVPRAELDRHRKPSLRGFMPDPSIFRDMDRAARRLADAVEAGEGVAIFGDYDVDGATSAALMVDVLRALGLAPVAYIPDRMAEGYGPNAPALRRLADAGASLIVTVDCGAQAFDALAAAAAAGIDVMVVDHHQCADTLPQALAVVNPNRRDEGADGAAHGHLAAVGVAFLLAAALVRELRARGRFPDRAAEPDLMGLLDLVALGTIADVAPLTGLNRALVAQGLKVMARRRRPGLAALADAARLTRPPGASDCGFALGPRINAGGRVGQADLGVRLLTTACPDEAAGLAARLSQYNEERRAIEAAVFDEAMAASGVTAHATSALTLVAATGWHAGVIGIVAGRLKERHRRPAIVIAIDDDGIGKGSGRSVPGVDLGAAILAAKDHGLLLAGGGHAMAAGLTVAADRIAALGAFLDDRLAGAVAAAAGARALSIDSLLGPRGIHPDYVAAIDEAGPYGAGWPAPRVATGPVRIVDVGVVGQDHLRLVAAGDDGARVKAIAFRAADGPLGRALLPLPRGTRLWLVGRVQRDDWNGREGAQLLLEDAALAA